MNTLTGSSSAIPPTTSSAIPPTSSTTSAGPPVTSTGETVGVVPVKPAELQQPPAAALDKVAEPSILDKAFGMGQTFVAKAEAVASPYVGKVQQTTKPYADAAVKKVESLMDKMDPQAHPVAGTPAAAGAQGGVGATSITAPSTTSTISPTGTLGTTAPASATSSTTAVGGPAGGKTFEDRLDGIFDNIQRRVSDAGKFVDEKTGSANKPGLFTQATSALQHLTDKADSLLHSHAPNATNANVQVAPAVPTTTNTVPHTEGATGIPAVPKV